MPSDWLHRRPPERSSTSASSCEGTEYTTALLERLGTLGHKCVSNTCSLLRHGERKQSHPTSDSSPVTCELQLAVGSRFPLTPFGGLTGHQLINVSFLRRHRWTFALFRWAFPPKPLVSSAGSLFEGGGARRTGGGWVWRCIRESSFTCSRAARSRARPGRAHGGICRWFSGTLQVKRSVVLWVESGWVFRPTAGLCVFGVSHLLRRRQCGHEAQRSPGGGWTHDVLGLARVILAEREMKESHLNS